MELEGKTVVITGASRGLGRALAIAFAKAGSNVVGLGKDAGRLEDTAAQITEGAFISMICDVGDWQQVSHVMDEIIARYQRIDVLFNNAALYHKVSFIEESAEEWSAAVAANIDGVAFCCKAALTHMLRAGTGRIYNLGSWAHMAPIACAAAYSASKGAVHALTKGIGQDLACLDTDVQVHEWVPGHLNTRMSDFTGIDPAVSAGWAVEMVRADAATNPCSIFENNYEWVPPKRLKERIVDRLLLRS